MRGHITCAGYVVLVINPFQYSFFFFGSCVVAAILALRAAHLANHRCRVFRCFVHFHWWKHIFSSVSTDLLPSCVYVRVFRSPSMCIVRLSFILCGTFTLLFALQLLCVMMNTRVCHMFTGCRPSYVWHDLFKGTCLTWLDDDAPYPYLDVYDITQLCVT